jgi:hypothetical protein
MMASINEEDAIASSQESRLAWGVAHSTGDSLIDLGCQLFIRKETGESLKGDGGGTMR